MESIIVDGVEYVPAASIVELQSLLAKHHAALIEQQKPGPWPTKEVIDKAVAAEREACARVCEETNGASFREVGCPAEGGECAAAIRARDE